MAVREALIVEALHASLLVRRSARAGVSAKATRRQGAATMFEDETVIGLGTNARRLEV